MTNLREKAIIGVKWTFISTVFKVVLQILQLIILARFLNAEDFGLVAIVMVVIGFSQLFMDMGISNAIIHKQNITDTQLSSLYWLNIFSGLILSFLIFSITPIVSSFYDNQNIIPLLQILSLTFFINGLGNQYKILLKKELKFNIIAKIEIIAVLFAFLTAVTLAIKGYGAYSLVYATLVNVIVLNIQFLKIGLKLHRPKFIYKHNEIKEFLTFGLYQMGQNSIVYFNNQFDVIIIGKLLGLEALGIYSLTKQLVMRPSQVINPIVTNVSFPIMATIHENNTKLKRVYLKIISLLSSINFPIYIIMIILANTLVPLILGEKWIESIIIFQVLSFYALIRSTMNPAGSLLLSKGRADIGLYWSLSEFTLMPIIIYFSSQWGILGVSLGLLSFQILMLLPNWFFIVKKMCLANFFEYFSIQIKPLITSIVTLGGTFILLNSFELSPITKLLLFTIIGLVFYIIISIWLNKQFINELKNTFSKRTTNENNNAIK